MGSQTLELKWANHKSNMTSELRELYLSDALLDVTIACGKCSLRAHKAVLSASSTFFRKLFIDNPCKHPILIMTDVEFEVLKTIVEFMYQGEVRISREKLSQFLKTADRLMVKGLSSIENINLIPSETDVYPHYFSDTREEENMEPQLQTTNKADVQSNPSNLIGLVQNNRNKEIPIIKLEGDAVRSGSDNCTYWESECFDHTLSSIVPDYNLSRSSAPQQPVSADRHQSPTASTPHQSSTSHPLLTPSVVVHQLSPPSASPEPVIPSAIDISSSQQSGVPLNGEGFKCLDNQTDSAAVTLMQEESTGRDINPANLYLSNDQSTVTLSTSVKTAFETIESFSSHSSQDGKTNNDVSTDHSASVSAVRSNTHCLKQNIVAIPGLGNTGHSSNFKCKFCKMLFVEQGVLEKHLKTVHFMLKKYICEVCNKCCSTKSNLQTHLRIHTGEKPYICKVCNKRFRHYSGLRYHKNTHTAGTLFLV